MPGVKPKEKVDRKWSSNLAYAIGLLTTDGCLSGDGRHIDFTSKDKDLVTTFLKCLGVKNKIGHKTSGHSGRKCFRVQFGDVVFYKFLLGIGLMPAKSKVMSELDIPDKYFFDFLRGHFDGDGTFYSYYDPRWKNSFMFYTVFISASKNHIKWLRNKIRKKLKVWGHVTSDINKSTHQLKYAKKDSLKILKKIYFSNDVVCLKRKLLKIRRALGIIRIRL